MYSNFLDTDPQTSAGLCQEILVAMKNRSHLGPQIKRITLIAVDLLNHYTANVDIIRTSVLKLNVILIQWNLP